MAACPHGDPTCPCQDGDWCHYEDDPVTGTRAEWCAHCEQAGVAVLIGTLAGVAQARAKSRRRR